MVQFNLMPNNQETTLKKFTDKEEGDGYIEEGEGDEDGYIEEGEGITADTKQKITAFWQAADVETAKDDPYASFFLAGNPYFDENAPIQDDPIEPQA